MANNNPVSDEWAHRIREMYAWIKGFKGDNVRSTGSSVYVGSPPGRCKCRTERPRPVEFWAEITGSVAIEGASNQWRYAWKMVHRTAERWKDDDYPDMVGRKGTTSEGWAINSAEANNAATGTQGNGVDLSAEPFTNNPQAEVKPVRGNPVVWMRRGTDDAGEVCYTFTYPNVVQGPCGEAA